MRRRNRPSPALFIEIWQGAETLDDAARALEMGPATAKSIASSLRNQGADLKVLHRRLRGPDRWDQADGERNNMDETTTVAIPDCTGIEIEFDPQILSAAEQLNHALYEARLQVIDLRAELAASVRLLRRVRVLLERSHTLLALRRGSAITEAENLIDTFLQRQEESHV